MSIRAGNNECKDVFLRWFNGVSASRKSNVFHYKWTGYLKLDTNRRLELSHGSKYRARTEQPKQHKQLAKRSLIEPPELALQLQRVASNCGQCSGAHNCRW